MKKWIKLLEATLCFDAWVNQDTFSKDELKCHNNTFDSNADLAIRQYMQLYTTMVHNEIGNGTKTSKVHWMLHIPHYICDIGPPKAYNGQTPQSIV